MEMAKQTELKVGDILFCHSQVIMRDGACETKTTIGKSYKIIKMLETQFIIINDKNDEHHFFLHTYKKWFYTLKQYRKLKLKKIKDVESW